MKVDVQAIREKVACQLVINKHNEQQVPVARQFIAKHVSAYIICTCAVNHIILFHSFIMHKSFFPIMMVQYSFLFLFIGKPPSALNKISTLLFSSWNYDALQKKVSILLQQDK
jgi:uncharacterized membrane protein YheB (UPF0754 family)